MKTKVIKIKDLGTEMYCMVTRPEEQDLSLLNNVDLGPDWCNVVFLDRRTFTWSGKLKNIQEAVKNRNVELAEYIIMEGSQTKSLPGPSEIIALISLSYNSLDDETEMLAEMVRNIWIDMKSGKTRKNTKRKPESRLNGPCHECGTTNKNYDFFEYDCFTFCSGDCKWKYHDRCPVCSGGLELIGKGKSAERHCINGHIWHVCLEHNNKSLGEPGRCDCEQ